jgi:rhamnogalacturonyl hydrolase YesR
MTMKIKKSQILKQALRGADWFANIQIINQKPFWDNNHGRLIYTRHMPTGLTILGINWTQARGIMCLLSAYERTGKVRYLKAAEMAADYILQLQVMDHRNLKAYGVILEEFYLSKVINVRDSAEAALALVYLYRVTKKKVYLERAMLWAKWYFKYGADNLGYPLFFNRLDTGKKLKSTLSFSAASAMVFYYLYRATRKPEYKTRGLKRVSEILNNRFVRASDGALLNANPPLQRRSSKERWGRKDTAPREPGVPDNDDGCGILLLQAYKLLKDRKYLDTALRYGDYILKQQLPYAQYSGLPSRFNYLMDLAHVSGKSKYSDFVFDNIGQMLKYQVRNKRDKMHDGAFRGEDEPTHWYVKDAKGTEYINTRTTAYSVLALFKMEGKVAGPYYSALGW